MNVGLFIPCYVDQLYPDVAMSTLELLEQFGCEVSFPDQQTCCGQPMANTGCLSDALPLAEKMIDLFSEFDAVVCPSGSCTSMVVNHYQEIIDDSKSEAIKEKYKSLKDKTYELCQFLTDILKVESLDVSFPYKVGLHKSCHGLRELRLGSCSERNTPEFSKAKQLLAMVDGIQFADLTRPDECCGFGGTFAVSEEAVSCMMGKDRIHDHEKAGVQVMTGGDMSCLMHMDGIIRRDKKPIQTMHIAEILAGRKPQGSSK